jgi:hypothetical protein
MIVYVIMANDFPDCVFSDKDVAEQYKEEKNAEDKRQYPGRRVFWRVYDFEMDHNRK